MVLSKDNHHPFKYTNRKRGAKAMQFQKRSLLSASFRCDRKVLKIRLSPEDFILIQSRKSLLFLPLGYTPQTTPLSMALPLLYLSCGRFFGDGAIVYPLLWLCELVGMISFITKPDQCIACWTIKEPHLKTTKRTSQPPEILNSEHISATGHDFLCLFLRLG